MTTRPNPTVNDAEYIILTSDCEMLALEEMFAWACPDKDFRDYLNKVIVEVMQACFFQQTAKEELDPYLRTNYFLTFMPNEIIDKPWAQYMVHSFGGAEFVDRRNDKRSTWLVLKTLADNLRQQLTTYQLYDRNGNAMFEYDPIVPSGSLEIRLKRIR